MKLDFEIPDELIEKYDCAAPRYTSYPTAPCFSDKFTAADYHRHALASNEKLLPRDLSLYIHVPFCHSLCYFCGCNKIVTQCDNSKVELYVNSLLKELAMRAPLFDDDRLVTQIHFGGGTPNFLSVDCLSEILNEIAAQFHLDRPSRLEASIEIDPRSASAEHILELSGIGFNRFSIGVQDFSRPVQEAVNRIQSEQATLETIAAALSVSESVNVDLITGLPGQTQKSFAETLEKVIDSGVTRIAAYGFAYLPKRIKAQRMIDPEQLPDAATRLMLCQTTRDVLLGAGFVHIGMDHYARKQDSLAIALKQDTLQRNFQGYTTHKGSDLVGIGASAISAFDDCYAQNAVDLSAYNSLIANHTLPVVKGISLSEDDRLRAAFIQQIMCRSQIDLSMPSNKLIDTKIAIPLKEYFAAELPSLQRFAEDGLLRLQHDRLLITSKGRFFMRQIASIFDYYFDRGNDSAAKVEKFSRAV